MTIGLLTYNNSERELTMGIAAAQIAMERAELPMAGQIYILDNGASTEHLTAGNRAITRFGTQGNIGFGAGHNIMMADAFRAGSALYIALNPDGMLHPDAISAIIKMVRQTEGHALIEALQFPAEHSKYYNPTTFDTPWITGACLAISRNIFETLGGFDDTFFMYCEDVDLSWRARANGYGLKICPQALFLHAVTNRKRNKITAKMIFDSGIILARKWGGMKFEKRLQRKMRMRGMPIPDRVPTAVPLEWRRHADFSYYFDFSLTRW